MSHFPIQCSEDELIQKTLQLERNLYGPGIEPDLAALPSEKQLEKLYSNLKFSCDHEVVSYELCPDSDTWFDRFLEKCKEMKDFKKHDK